MTQAQALALFTDWQHWDGRIVGGKFPLLQYLGGSERSAVYLTEFNHVRAAIKLIPADDPQTAAQLASWKLAAPLSHPNLVRIFETGLWHADDEQDMHFAIMEYCDESLAGVLRQRPLTAGEARVMLAPTLEALKYLHARSLVHGQINPRHLLASGDQLKLTTDKLCRNGEAFIASPPSPYDTPEKTPGLSSDIWALGITLVEALTKRLPVRNAAGIAEVPEKLPAPFEAIVKGCLTPDRERRLTITGIRTLLDAPGPEIVLQRKPVETTTQEKPVAAAPVVELARSGNRPLSILDTAAQESPVPRSVRARAILDRRGFLGALLALCAVIALLVGLRLTSGKAANTPTAAQPEQHSAPIAPTNAIAPAAKALPNAPGSVTHQVLPDITHQARATITGTVKVSVRVAVNADGKVSRATLATHGPSPYFAKRTLDAARQWTFTAPVRDGRAQASEWTIRFEFRRGGTRAVAHNTGA